MIEQFLCVGKGILGNYRIFRTPIKVRKAKEILKLEDMTSDLLWYNHHLDLRKRYSKKDREIADKAAEKLKQKYEDGVIYEIKDPYEKGYLDGVVSSLRWVLGSEFDNTDT